MEERLLLRLYEIKKEDFNELIKYNLKSVFFYLEDNLIGSTVTDNNLAKINLNAINIAF